MNKQGAKYKISPRGKRKLDYPTKVSKPSTKLPLIGKTIYLDVKETKHLKRLQQDLKKLGATLEDFVSRDINYLITSQPRPKNKAANPCGDDSPTPSPFNCDPSPSPGYPEDKKVTSVTRGKALLEKARYTRQASTLVDNAEKWGVKIVTIEGAFKWIDKELKKLPKSTGNLSKKNIKPKCVSSYKLFKSPFVKLEAESFCYRPFHTELDVWPRLNVDTPRGSCPFDGTLIKGGDESREERGELLAAQVDIPSEDTPKEEKDGSESADSTPKPAAEKSGKKSDSDVFGGSRIMTAGELKRKKDLKRKQERKRGYCECCHVKYEDLDKHVKEEQHRQYVKTKTNYSQLDTLINSGPNTQHFLYEYLTKAAHIVNIKSGNSHNCFNENTSRRSPRKAVQDSTLKSLMKSPSKNAQQTAIQSPSKCQSPGKPSMRVPLQTVRVSPRKNLQKLSNDENLVPPVETQGLTVLETKQSPGGRTRRNSETKTAKASPDLQASAGNTAMASGCRTPRLRGHTVLQKETDMQHKSGSNEREKFGKIKDIVEEETKDAEIALSRNAASREKEESFGKTLSNVCVNKVMENSPKKKTSPRKQLVKSFAQENCEGSGVSQNLNKENISPRKQHINVKETVTEKSSHCKELKKTETDENQRCSEINTSNRKCAEKSRKKNTEDLVENLNEGESNPCNKSLNKSIESSEIGASSDELDMSNYELTRVGFAEIVNYGKKRIEKEHSSDDFEVCFARSLEGETLPMWKKSSKEAVDKTFDEMVVHYEKSGVMNNYNDSLTFDENETEIEVNRTRKSPHKKHNNSGHEHLTKGKLMFKQAETDMSLTESGNKKCEKEKDVFDIDMESDIPSDFQCYNEQGKLVAFSKTLAERIKERSLGRRSSVESYNMNVLFQLPSRSRSNSFSSNHSDRTTKKVATVKSKQILNKVEKKKTGSSIASAKVVNKYRSKRLGRVQNDNNVTGYQGDDENERTPEIRKLEQSQVSQKKPRQKFWHYETVYESKEKVEHDKELKGLPKELRELKGTSGWFSSDTSDVESRRSRKKFNEIENTELKKFEAFGTDMHSIEGVTEQRSTADEKNVTGYQGDDKNERTPEIRNLEQSQVSQKKPRQKFWHYETVYESKEKVEVDKELKGLPKELRELKGTRGWFSTDTSDVESRRSRKKLNKIENTELKRIKSIENGLEKENQSEQNKPRESCKLRNLSTNFETEIEPGKSQRNCNNYSDLEHSCKMSPAENDKTEVVQQKRKNRKKSEGVRIDKNSADECLDQTGVKQTLNKNQSELDEASEKKYTASEKETKTVKHKTRKQFWDFVPVKDSPKKENVHKIPKELRDSWNIGDSLTRCERRNSRKLPEYEETDRSSTDEDHDENAIRKPLSRNKSELHENNDSNYRGSEKEMKKNNFKKRKQLRDFVPVERENTGKIPKELRDSWNTGDTLNRYDRRNSRKLPDYEETDSCSSDDDHDENTIRKPLSRNESELHEKNDRNYRATEKEMKKNNFKKRKQLGDFVPLEDNVERENTGKMPKELRDSWNTGDTLNRYDRRNSRKLPDYEETDRSSTDEDHDENTVGKPLSRNQSELHEKDDRKNRATEKEMKKNFKKRKQLGDFVPVADNVERENNGKIPKELRDSWNTGDTLNRYDRRNSRKLPEYEETDSCSSDDDHDENTIRKPLSRNESELHENNDRKYRASEKEMKKNKFKKPKQFWDFVPVEDKVERENTSKIPKELRDSWNTGDTLNKYDRRNSRKWRDNVETHSSTDEDFNENEVGKALKGNKNKLNETDDLLGTSGKALKNSKPKSHKKYWDFITIEDNIDEERHDADNLPKELRQLKLSKSYIFTSDSSDTDKRLRTRRRQLQKRDKVDIGGRHLRRKDTGVNYNESDCQDSDCQSDISGCCKGSGSEESSAAENKDAGAEKRTRLKSRKHYHETNKAKDIVLNDAANTGQFKTGENNSDRDIGGVDNSDNDFSRPQSKRKVVPVEEKSVNVNKTLPKEVQMLHSTVERRSRSCQSRPNVNDAEKTNFERSSRKCDKCLEGHTHNCIVVVEERSVKDCERFKTKNNGKGAVLAEKYSRNTQKNSNLRDDCSQGLVSDEEERSVSPVFSNVHCQQNKVVRRRSPVFNRSPLLQLGTRCNKAQKKNSQNYVVKGKSIKPNNSSNVHSKTNQKRIIVDNSSGKHGKTQQSIKNSGDYCSDSEDELHADMNNKEISLNKVNNCSVDTVKTPEKSAPVKQPGSGYSNTPREKRRKQWKRKIVDSESACPEEKKRKLEHTTDAMECSEIVPTNLTIKTTPRRRLLESELKENQKIGEKNDDVLTGFSEIKEKTQSVSHNDVDDQFSLTWKPVNADKVENKCEKVKLNRSWTMLSERSVSKLLSSEDDNENFDGFTDEDTLPSDMSYEEQSEVELPNDDQHEWVVEDKDEKSEIEENLIKYVPVFFPSPNKTSNSSWNDAIEGYIDNSVKHGPDSSFKGDNSSAYFSFNISPRKSPMKQNCASPQKVTGQINSAKITCSPLRVNRQSTPKRKRNRHVQSPEVERVDAEIEFNFGSPRKNCSDFSPLKTVNGIVRNLSNTVNLTSTPVLKKSKKQKQKRTK